MRALDRWVGGTAAMLVFMLTLQVAEETASGQECQMGAFCA